MVSYNSQLVCMIMLCHSQGRRNTFKTRGAEDSRYIRGRFASEASENFLRLIKFSRE